MVGKGENARYQHFLLFLQCFLKFSELVTYDKGSKEDGNDGTLRPFFLKNSSKAESILFF